MYKLFLLIIISFFTFQVEAGGIARRAKAIQEQQVREAANNAEAAATEVETQLSMGNIAEANAAKIRTTDVYTQAIEVLNRMPEQARAIAIVEQARAQAAVQWAEAAITAATIRSTPSTTVEDVPDMGVPPVISTAATTTTATEVNSSGESDTRPSTVSLPLSSPPSFQNIMTDMGTLATSLRHRLVGEDGAEAATAGPRTPAPFDHLTVSSSADPQIDALMQRVPPSTGNRLRVVMDWVCRQEKAECFMMEGSTLQEIIQRAIAAQDIPAEVLEARLKGYNLLNIHGQLDDILPPGPAAPAFIPSTVSGGGGGAGGSTDETTVSPVPHLPRGFKAPDLEEDPTTQDD